MQMQWNIAGLRSYKQCVMSRRPTRNLRSDKEQNGTFAKPPVCGCGDLMVPTYDIIESKQSPKEL